jgi:hypothetical protein
VRMAESDDQCGIFLELLQGDKQIARYKCKVIK